MLLGGLWHGAGWTYIIWGGLHGVYLVINHAWHALRRWLGHDLTQSTWHGRVAGRALTFLAVVLALVVFRADGLHAAGRVLAGMAGANGVWLPASYLSLFGPLGPILQGAGWRFETLDSLLFGGVAETSWLAALLAIAFLLPNTQEWVGYLGGQRSTDRAGGAPLFVRLAAALPRWQPTMAYGSVLGVILCYCLLSIFAETPSEFLYFQF
jgi:alginate O-acetyltransferase complex protein AlgI